MKNKNLAKSREVIVHNALNESADYKINELANGAPVLTTDSDSWVDVRSGVNEFALDLGSSFSVCGFSVTFLHDVEKKVISPETVKLLLSENGNEFYEVAKVNAPYPASFKYETKAFYEAELSEPCLARFVKIRFCGEIITKCAELKVFGSEPDGNELHLSGAVFKSVSKNQLAKADSLSEVDNVPLVTFCSFDENGNALRLKREDFKPLLSYVDRNGNEKKEMFTSIALCQSPLGECPSGGCMTYYSEKISRLSDWEFLIDELFAENANLKALNEEYASLKNKMGVDRDEKLKVYLTVPMPKISFETFGDLNGDGVEEKLLTTEDCIAAFNWYVDAVVRRFNAECLPNLKIEGFVWNNDRITREFRDDETYFVKECVSSLHDRGYKCMFVGSQNASGVEKADKVKFDCSTLTLSEKPLVSVYKNYGLGINIVSPASPSDREGIGSFVKQISDCISLGMLNTVHTFQNANVFATCATSEIETDRLVYDGLYEFLDQKSKSKEEVESEETLPENISEIVEELVEENVNVSASEQEEIVVAEIFEEFKNVDEQETAKPEETVESVIEIEEAVEETVIEEIEETVDENSDEKEFSCKKTDFIPYEGPAFKIEISVPSSENNECPDRKCGYCSKYFPQNKTSFEPEEKIKQQCVEEQCVEELNEQKTEQPVEQVQEIVVEKVAEPIIAHEEPIVEPIIVPEKEDVVEEISEPIVEQTTEREPKQTIVDKLPKFAKKPDKKTALAAAGIAVALGTAYLIAKNLKGNKNG